MNEMKWIRKPVLEGKVLCGSFLNLGSSLTVEIAGRAGFDWLLIDLEHGAGDRQNLLHQLQAVESTPAAPIVRIGWNDPVTFKRILDLGPSGIMVPWVNSADEARQAAASMQYPPRGIRGAAFSNRACGYGQGFDEYFQAADSQLLLVTQIETEKAVEEAEEIAAVDRVDVLFVGPLDLSVSMGAPRQFDREEFRSALRRVVDACRKHGKAAGILAGSPEQARLHIDDGFTFVACGSDGTLLSAEFQRIASALGELK